MLRKTIAATFGAAEPRNLRTHVGLWIDKMLLAEEPSSQVAGPHLRKIVEAPIPDGYELAYQARRALFDGAADREECLLFEATTTSRLVVGLGAKGVLEMGLTLDHTWGAPCIPGSALKGLCATAAQKLTEGEGWKKPQGWPDAAPDAKGGEPTDYQVLFGTTANAGKVRFHDAWWVPAGSSLPIHLDVMTVHHPDYYQSGGARPESAPTDFDEPVPVPFLSTSGTFLVALEGPRAWCKVAGELLEAGLAELGAGAKTSSGYGRLTLTGIVSEGERERRAQRGALQRQLEGLQRQLERYEPGHKQAVVQALARAMAAGAGPSEVAAALRKVEKGPRAGLLEGLRAALDEAGRGMLEAALAELAPAAKAPAEGRPEAPEAESLVAQTEETSRRTRARYEEDKKSPKRFFLHLEGEKKPLKGAVVEIGSALLERLRATKGWVDVVVWSGSGKVRIEAG